jgi:pyruvate/2-oxoglutarate dehydrogenase complex dihydrolipoamide dehydrogenase (E3) component
MEMAQAHRRLGSKVTVIEGAKALGKDDPEAAALVLTEAARRRHRDRRRRQGLRRVRQGRRRHGRDRGRAQLRRHPPAVAVGRQVNVDKLDLEKARVDYDRRGVTVDKGLRSTNKRVYAVGDAAGGLQFTHVAGYHAGVIIRPMLFGLPAKARTDHIPWATYTDPELAQVGLTEAQAREQHGDKLFVAKAEFHHNDRAIATGQTEGFAKVMVVKGKPVGATIVGAAGGRADPDLGAGHRQRAQDVRRREHGCALSDAGRD